MGLTAHKVAKTPWPHFPLVVPESKLLGVGAEVGSGSDDELVRALRQGTSSSINQAGQQVVQRQLGIRPTLTIRPGVPLLAPDKYIVPILARFIATDRGFAKLGRQAENA